MNVLKPHIEWIYCKFATPWKTKFKWTLLLLYDDFEIDKWGTKVFFVIPYGWKHYEISWRKLRSYSNHSWVRLLDQQVVSYMGRIGLEPKIQAQDSWLSAVWNTRPTLLLFIGTLLYTFFLQESEVLMNLCHDLSTWRA